VRIVVACPTVVLRDVFVVPSDYIPHSFVPGSHERHQALILGDSDELEKRI